MKWKTKKYVPEEGYLRRVRKFAFLPKVCGPYTVWLESYESKQRYTKLARFVDGVVPIPYMDWVEIERNHLELYL